MFYYHICPPWFNQMWITLENLWIYILKQLLVLAYLLVILREVPIEVYGMC